MQLTLSKFVIDDCKIKTADERIKFLFLELILEFLISFSLSTFSFIFKINFKRFSLTTRARITEIFMGLIFDAS